MEVRNLWTEEEKITLVTSYENGGLSEAIANIPNRTPKAVQLKVNEYKKKGKDKFLNTTASTSNCNDYYSAEEIEVVKRVYPVSGAAGVHKILTNRSLYSIRSKAYSLKVKYVPGGQIKTSTNNALSDKELYFINGVLSGNIAEIDAASALKIPVSDIITMINSAKDQQLISPNLSQNSVSTEPDSISIKSNITLNFDNWSSIISTQIKNKLDKALSVASNIKIVIDFEY